MNLIKVFFLFLGGVKTEGGLGWDWVGRGLEGRGC